MLNSKRTILLGILTLILDLHSSMSNYLRPGIAGGTYFITQVTYHPPPQPVLFFHKIDSEIIKFVSTGNSATRFFRLIVLVSIMAIWFVSVPYLVVDVLVRIFGNAIHGRSKINSLILETLNEMYIKSLIEVAPYLDEGTLQKVFSAQSPKKVLLP